MEILNLAKDFLYNNWEILLVLAGWFWTILAIRRSQSTWRRRSFLSRVNFSLNFLDPEDPTRLKFRTLRESDLSELLLNNQHGISMVLRAAKDTTLHRPMLQLPKDESWVVMNAMLNEISEQFSAGILAQGMNVPVRKAWFLFALTCEKDSDIPVNKIRLLIVEESQLDAICDAENLQFEQPHHNIRVKTLQQIRDALVDKNRKHLVMRIELAVPCA